MNTKYLQSENEPLGIMFCTHPVFYTNESPSTDVKSTLMAHTE